MNTDLDDAVNRCVLQGGFGLPQERLARMAAARTFVAMKLGYLEASMRLRGRRGESIAEQLRRADEPCDLWRLKVPMASALDASGDHGFASMLDAVECIDADRAIDTHFVIGENITI
jgi:hypothetical protein